MSITQYRSTEYHPLWGCLLCHNKYVKASLTHCPTCRQRRGKDRFGLLIDGVYYLAHVETVNLRCVAHIHIVRPLRRERSFKLPLKDKDGMSHEDSGTLEAALILSIREYQQAQEATPRAVDSKTKLKMKAALEKAVQRQKYQTPLSEVFHTLFNTEVSLFDRVMKNANEMAYDAKIGQYVSVETVAAKTMPKISTGSQSPKHRTGSRSPKHRTGSRSPKHGTGSQSPKHGTGSQSPKHGTGSRSPKHCTTTQPGNDEPVATSPKQTSATSAFDTMIRPKPELNHIKQDLTYVEYMKRERVVMRQTVKEVVNRRQQPFLYDSRADLDIVQSEREKRVECALCEHPYPNSQLLGQISFRTVAKWRSEHEAPFPPHDHRLDPNNINNAARLCLFCTQFFGGIDIIEMVDVETFKQRMGMEDIHFEGPLNCSNVVHKKLFRKFAENQRNSEKERPLSGLKRRIAVEGLRWKAQQLQSAVEGNRFVFNPKVPNAVIDQEKAGHYLRTKYAAGSEGLLLLEKRRKKEEQRQAEALKVSLSADASEAVATEEQKTESGKKHNDDGSSSKKQLKSRSGTRSRRTRKKKSQSVVSAPSSDVSSAATAARPQQLPADDPSPKNKVRKQQISRSTPKLEGLPLDSADYSNSKIQSDTQISNNDATESTENQRRARLRQRLKERRRVTAANTSASTDETQQLRPKLLFKVGKSTDSMSEGIHPNGLRSSQPIEENVVMLTSVREARAVLKAQPRKSCSLSNSSESSVFPRANDTSTMLSEGLQQNAQISKCSNAPKDLNALRRLPHLTPTGNGNSPALVADTKFSADPASSASSTNSPVIAAPLHDENEEYAADFEAEEHPARDVTVVVNEVSAVAHKNSDEEVAIFLDHVFDSYDQQRQSNESIMKPPLPLRRSRSRESAKYLPPLDRVTTALKNKSSDDEIDEDEIDDILGAASSSRSTSRKTAGGSWCGEAVDHAEEVAEVEEEIDSEFPSVPEDSTIASMKTTPDPDELSVADDDYSEVKEEEEAAGSCSYSKEDFEMDEYEDKFEENSAAEAKPEHEQEPNDWALQGESKESYNWAVGSPVGQSRSTEDRFSPGELGRSLPAAPIDRIRLLSRGSRAASRGASSSAGNSQRVHRLGTSGAGTGSSSDMLSPVTPGTPSASFRRDVNSRASIEPRFLTVLSPATDIGDESHAGIPAADEHLSTGKEKRYSHKPHSRSSQALGEAHRHKQSRGKEHRRLNETEIQRLRVAAAAVHVEQQRYKQGIGGLI